MFSTASTAAPSPPSYGAQLAAGATTLTEAWDANPASSQNHCMLGHVEEWFYSGLGGIRLDPAAAGFQALPTCGPNRLAISPG